MWQGDAIHNAGAFHVKIALKPRLSSTVPRLQMFLNCCSLVQNHHPPGRMLLLSNVAYTPRVHVGFVASSRSAITP